MTVLIALTAFFAPIFAGLLVPYSVSMPGVWLTCAICEAPVCQAFHQPFAFVAAVMSMLVAALAVTISRPFPPARLPWRQRRQHAREVQAFQRDLKQFGKCDLEHAEQYDPKPGDERVA